VPEKTSWTVKVSPQAERYFKRLDKPTQNRIKKAFKNLCKSENPVGGKDVIPLTGELRGAYRLRVGGYRVIFYLIEDKRIIAVVNLWPRGDAY
jgi:mRNA interferase RelE/StbE